MKGSEKLFGIGLLALGFVILFLGDSIQNIGDQVDALVTNKWTGVIALGLGAIILFGPSFKLKIREI